MTISFGNNYSNIPYIMEGEIIGIHKYPKDTSKIIKPPRYTCRLALPNGSNIIINNVIEATMFGGIADYLQIRHRTSQDASKKPGSGGALGALASVVSSAFGGGGYTFDFNDEKANAKVGDRVYISFINGFITRPVIIGYAQHPNQVDEFKGKDASEVEPNLIFQYNGIRATIDEEGQLTVIHKGPPEISEKPGAGAKSYGGGGAVGAALSAIGGGSLEPENEAVKFPDQKKQRTLFEFLKDGTFRIRDAEGQVIEVNTAKKEIMISNNSTKSTDSLNGLGALVGAALGSLIPMAESIKLKGSDKEVEILSRKTIVAKAGLGTIKSENGKFAIGTQAAELFDLLTKILEQLDTILTQIQSITVPTAVGPSGPPVNTPAFATAQAQLKVITQLLGTIKGSI
jgi:hypothetical protein